MGLAQQIDDFDDLNYLEKMILSPRDYFNRPSEVLTLGSVSYHEKIELLENWKQGVEDLMRAQGEGMAPSIALEGTEHLEQELEEVGKVLIRLNSN